LFVNSQIVITILLVINYGNHDTLTVPARFAINKLNTYIYSYLLMLYITVNSCCICGNIIYCSNYALSDY